MSFDRGGSMATGESSESATLADEAPAWTPGPDVLNHAGDPIAADADFFAPPPDEIGTVITAHSTLRRGQRPFSAPARGALMFVPGFVAIGLMEMAGHNNLVTQIGVFVVLFAAGAW